MEGESSTSNPMEMTAKYWTEIQVKQEELTYVSSDPWPNIKVEAILDECNEDIKTENHCVEDSEDTEIEAPGHQFLIEHIELKEEDIKLEWKGSEPTLEGERGSIPYDNNSGTDYGFKEQEGLNSVPESRSYKCFMCKWSFSQKSHLKVHIVSVHEKLKPFKCNKPSCNYACSFIGNLNKHLKSVHQKLKPYMCESCDYACSQKRDLSKHIMAVHKKLKAYKCPNCDFECCEKSNLSQHIKSVHEKLRQFKCSDCNYEFSRNENLSRHMKTVHEKLKQVTR